MKSQVRVLAIDDSPFTFDQATTDVYGVVVRIPGYIEHVLSTSVEVDGGDATGKVLELVDGTGIVEQLKCVLVDGAALGGFNVVDIEEVNRKTNVPVITVTRDRPDMESIEAALKKHFEDWEERLEALASQELREVDTGHNPIFISVVGMDVQEAIEVIKSSIVRGAIPEPLRIAHEIASRKRL